MSNNNTPGQSPTVHILIKRELLRANPSLTAPLVFADPRNIAYSVIYVAPIHFEHSYIEMQTFQSKKSVLIKIEAFLLWFLKGKTI